METDKKSKFLIQTVQLADRLAADIRNRKLKPGETYYTTLEASRFLGVAGATANRALQLLEKRHIIQRSQRRGAMILEPLPPEHAVIDHVHFLVHDKYYRTEGIGADGVLLGIQSELPTSIVSHCFLSPESEMTQVSNLIDRSLAGKTTDAFILVRASYESQRMIAQSGIPALVYGSLFQGINHFSVIDRDHAAAIRLTTDYLQKKGRQHVAVLMRHQVMAGDHQTFDALLNHSPFALTLRFTPQENEAIEAETYSILNRAEHPDAFLCHTLRHAECVDRVRRELKINDLDIVVLSTFLKRGETTRFPHIVIDSDPETIGRRLGVSLLNRVAGNQTQEILPVKFVVPKKGKIAGN
ncbi:MAG: GntR family transcriptional regulator [Planctomycetaceae bacterium]|jgi:DNA-binding LacI/PurR family transcriptional regulator/DNA-binding transcriptional regulator YhcF (GntR family)|nr:GntR family transcriptional regulator [Planctomycetaceae bacterium]